MASWNAVDVGPGCSVLTGFGVMRTPWPPLASIRPDRACRDVAREPLKAHQADDARGDDDASAVGNVRRAVLEDVKRAEHVDRESPCELVRRVLANRSGRSADTGVTEENVEATVALDALRDCGRVPSGSSTNTDRLPPLP
jgi:hypothetical protein